ncbi:MAG TPA: DnaJ domain-containing protein [Alloprevotella sp.]|nr:DnaJ domain-containing protein [Alloprevotella sp.]
MAFIDYYKIMGINKETPQKEIRAAYKKRAKQFHPDLHPNDPKAKAKFQALNEAYDVLNDPEKRKKYDQYGEHWKQAEIYEGAGGGFGNGAGTSWGDSFSGFDFSQFNGESGGFSSFFENLFGGSRRTGASYTHEDTRNYNMEVSIDIDMYTALLGGDIILQTQNGKLKLKVKPETQNGSKVRLRGKGYGKRDGTFGDLIITYKVKLPTGLSEHQKELLREMRNS